MGIDADVFGLQEVDPGQLVSLLCFEALGWDHVYCRKAGAAADGCALFWRRGRFQLEGAPFSIRLGGSLAEMPELAPDVRKSLCAHAPTMDVLAKVTTVAQGVLLRDLAIDGRRLLVANTHLYYHPEANHIRLIQLHTLLSELSRRKQVLESDGGGPIALILLGDLNARKGNFGPTDVGAPPQAAYRLFRDGVISPRDTDWLHSRFWPEEWRTQSTAEQSRDTTVCICCNDTRTVVGYGACPLCDGVGCEVSARDVDVLRMELRLPYAVMDPNHHVQVSTYTASFQECIDYTLLDENHLRATRLMEMPPVERLREETALPSSVFPSDHIPIITDVCYKDLC